MRTEGDYAAEMREEAAAEMDALVARLVAAEGDSDGEGQDVEAEANVDAS